MLDYFAASPELHKVKICTIGFAYLSPSSLEKLMQNVQD